MSHLMDYGDDWPPKPEPSTPKPRRCGSALWRKCVTAVVVYVLIGLGGLGLLAIKDAAMGPLTPPAVSETLAPAPCTVTQPCERSSRGLLP